MRLTLAWIAPPLAVLFCGSPVSAFLTPPWWAIPLPIFAFLVLGLGIPHLAALFGLLWLWPYARSRTFAITHVMNHLENKRIRRLEGQEFKFRVNSPLQSTGRRASLRLLPSPPSGSDDPGTGHDGFKFRKKK